MLNRTKNKTRVTQVVEITAVLQVSCVEKSLQPRITKIIEIIDTTELPIKHLRLGFNNRNNLATELNRTKKVNHSQDLESIPPNEPLAILQIPMSTSNFLKSKIP